MKIHHRLGDAPRVRGCVTGEGCPDVFQLIDGDFAVIGAAYDAELPSGVTLGPGQRLVVVDRDTLVRARRDIPDF
ncbi:hypothetical protein GTY60_01955 [Streptomyces sp. SID8367]|nr:hypothetical protein [Streptomyces sp. SID8367]MYT68439.1 hypothetical protein [Streptomyces sp. SID8367]